MPEILLRKHFQNLVPIDAAGAEVLRSMSQNEITKAKITRPRNVQFHRKFFAMLKIVLDNQDHYKSTDDLLAVCKLRVGHVHVIGTKQGEVRIPKSISFAAMDETAFTDFYNRAVDWVVREVIPGLKAADLNAEVEAQLLEFAG